MGVDFSVSVFYGAIIDINNCDDIWELMESFNENHDLLEITSSDWYVYDSNKYVIFYKESMTNYSEHDEKSNIKLIETKEYNIDWPGDLIKEACQEWNLTHLDIGWHVMSVFS